VATLVAGRESRRGPEPGTRKEKPRLDGRG